MKTKSIQSSRLVLQSDSAARPATANAVVSTRNGDIIVTTPGPAARFRKIPITVSTIGVAAASDVEHVGITPQRLIGISFNAEIGG